MAINLDPFNPSVTLSETDMIVQTDDKIRTITDEMVQHTQTQTQSAADQLETKVDTKLGEVTSNPNFTYTVEVIDSKFEDIASDKPTISGATAGVETTKVNITISNYSPTATYNINVSGGIANRVNNIIEWTLPVVDATGSYDLSVSGVEVGKVGSAIATHSVNVTNAVSDQVVLFQNATISITEFPNILIADGSTNTSTTDATETHTANAGTNGSVSASTERTAQEAWRAFDGISSSTDGWSANATTGWIQYLFNTAKIINKYMIHPRDNELTRGAKDWTLKASLSVDGNGDLIDPVTLDTRANITDWENGTWKTFTFTNATAYKYYRLEVTANNGDVSYLRIAELKLIEAQSLVDLSNNTIKANKDNVSIVSYKIEQDVGDGDFIAPEPKIVNKANLYTVLKTKDATSVPAMTSDTSPSGTVFVTSVNGAGYEGYRAFDRILSSSGGYNCWATPSGVTAGKIGFIYDSPIAINEYSFYVQNGASYLASGAKNWTLEASHNTTDGENGDWEVLDTQSDIMGWTVNGKKVFKFANNTAYKAYRLNITANNGYSYLTVEHLEFFEAYEYSKDSITISGELVGNTILVNDGESTDLNNFDTTGKVTVNTNEAYNKDTTDLTADTSTNIDTGIAGKSISEGVSIVLDLTITDSSTAGIIAIGMQRSGNANNSGISINAAGGIQAYAYQNSGTTTKSGSYTQGQRMVIIASFDSSGDVDGFYIDSVAQSGGVLTGYDARTHDQANIWIGARGNGGVNYGAKFTLHQAKIFEKTISANEAALFKVGDLNALASYTLDLTSLSLTNVPKIVARDTADIETSLVATGSADSFAARNKMSHTVDNATTPTKITTLFDSDNRQGRDFKVKVNLAKSGDEVSKIEIPISKV